MYFDDQNQNPVSGGMPEGENIPNNGEYHYTRENNPGQTSFQAGSGSRGEQNSWQEENRQNSWEQSQNRQNSWEQSQNRQNSWEQSQNRQNSWEEPQTRQKRRTHGPFDHHYEGYQPNYNPGDYGAPYEQSRASRRQPKRTKTQSGMGGKMVALMLACSLAGGVVGGGAVYGASAVRSVMGGGTATVTVSDRTGGVETEKVQVAAGEYMTPAQTYSTYGSAVVSVTVTTRQGEGAGTGFIIDGKEGYLLTCYHVIDGAMAISVTLTDSTSFPAEYIGGDEDQDVAILKIQTEEGQKLDLNSMVLGDSELLAVGDEVCAIGNALGTLANTLTSGHVSALDRAISMSDGTVMNLMQTDTTINSGNSGGPLFNAYGEVIGIVNAKYSSSAQDGSASIEGIGFAIPINDVVKIMDDLMEHGYITGKPYLGISVATVSAVAAQQYSDMVVGAYVSSVSSGSCAEAAGLQVGDIITQVDGKDITTSAELIDAKNAHRAGEQMTLLVYRKSDYVTLKVTLDEEKPTESPIDDGKQPQSSGNSGGSDYGYSWPFGFGNGNSSSGGFSWPFGYGW